VEILGAMESSILELLGQHESLGADQIAAHLAKRLDAVNEKLREMRDRGLVDVLTVGELKGNLTTAASYWRLTDKGRNELARRRSE
jgi:predicted ArsR family transcriptional regulator